MKIKDTELLEINDDIFKFSLNNVDCSVLWLKSGLSGLYSDWIHVFLPKISKMKLHVISGSHIYEGLPEEIFLHPDHRFFEISPGFNKLKYLYIFPNSENTWIDTKTINTIPELINNALNTITKTTIKDIAFNGILGSGEHGHDKNVDDEIAKNMISYIKDWLNKNKTSIEKIYLVNKVGRGFNLE
ncbi:MAG: hypothetical protein KA369_05740 [Spirochaetes bacterium]|nr:hypothetical protein [Spirochaetota bacterium]